MNAPQVHLMLNHVPVLGAVFATIMLAAGLLLRRGTLVRFALATIVVISLAAVPAYLSGERSEEAVEHLAGVREQTIEQHEDAALVVMIGLAVLALGSLASLYGYRRIEIPRRVATTILLGGLVLSGAMAWMAHLGGQIRHAELVNTQSAATETGEREGDDD